MNRQNRRSIPRAIAVAAGAILLLSGMTLHHGWSNYHQSIELTYRGVITGNDIGNPHTYVDLRVHSRESKSDSAAAYDSIPEWNVVLAPLSRMQRRGMSDNSMLDVGDTVTVVGYPHKTVGREMRAERIFIGSVKIELR